MGRREEMYRTVETVSVGLSNNVPELKKQEQHLWSRWNNLVTETDALKTQWREVKDKLEKTCNHMNPDGKSAITQYYDYSECSICGYGDR